VSSCSMARLIARRSPGVVTIMSRYARRIASVCAMPSLAKRLSHVGVLSSIASRPRSPATSAWAVSMSRDRFMAVAPVATAMRASAARRGSCDGAVDDRLRLLQDPLQVVGAGEALGVDLVDVLGARRPRRVPAALGDHLDAADRRAVARRLVEHALDLLAGELARAELVGSERRELLLLRGVRRRLDTVGDRVA